MPLDEGPSLREPTNQEIRAALRIGAETGIAVSRGDRYLWAFLAGLAVCVAFLGYTVSKQHDRLELMDVRYTDLKVKYEKLLERTR